MQAIKPQYIKDEKGETLGVFLSKAEFEYLTKKIESVEDVGVEKR
ncbi:MAG: hypothetical protein AAF806_26810 [Bacteroidota bacterium]